MDEVGIVLKLNELLQSSLRLQISLFALLVGIFTKDFLIHLADPRSVKRVNLPSV